MKGLLAFCLAIALGISANATGIKELDTFSYMGVTSLDIRGESLDVEVVAGDGFSTSMSGQLPQDSLLEPRGYRVLHEMIGSRLSVWVEQEPGPFTVRKPGRLSFSVPRGIEISVETSSGRVGVSGLETIQASVKSVSGSIEIRRFSGGLRSSTVSGSLQVDDLRGDAWLSTVSGRVGVYGSRGALSIRTVSGSIEGNGVDLSADSYFGSTSGAIDLRLDNRLDDLRFELSTVSGELAVGTIRARKGLRMGEGRTTVRGETISGSQSYR